MSLMMLVPFNTMVGMLGSGSPMSLMDVSPITLVTSFTIVTPGGDYGGPSDLKPRQGTQQGMME